MHETREAAARDHLFDQPIAEQAPPAPAHLESRIMRQSRLEEHAAGLAHDVLIGALADRLRCCRRGSSAGVALFGRENARTALCSLPAPSMLATEHMHGIARCERREARESRIGEAAQRLEPGGIAHHFGHVARLERQCIPDSPFERGQVCGRCAIGITQCKLRRVVGKPLEFRERAQLREDGRKTLRQQAQGHGLARTDAQPQLPVEVDFAVAAEAAGAHIHRLDHRAPDADERALGAHDGASPGHHRDVRGGAAHVGNDEIRSAGEKPRSDDARRRTRQDGLDRVLERNLRLHQ